MVSQNMMSHVHTLSVLASIATKSLSLMFIYPYSWIEILE